MWDRTYSLAGLLNLDYIRTVISQNLSAEWGLYLVN